MTFWLSYIVGLLVSGRYLSKFWMKELEAESGGDVATAIFMGYWCSMLWPMIWSGLIAYKTVSAVYSRRPETLTALFVAREPKRARLEQKRQKAIARVAQLERELGFD